MSWLDVTTMTAAAALVVTVCGLLYLADMLHRRGNAAAQVWAVAFVGGILTTQSYLIWATLDEVWEAGLVGNTALVLTIGMLWLGCVRFNGPLTPLSGSVVAVAVLATLVAGLIGGSGKPWEGSGALFVAVAVLAALGGVETRRGRLAEFDVALWLTVVFGVVSAFYAARTVLLVTVGTEAPVFQTWFGTSSAAVLTIVLTITAVVTMMVLRVQTQERRNEMATSHLVFSESGYLDLPSFQRVLATRVVRARALRQPMAVLAVQLDGLEEIGAAFGGRITHELIARWREVTLRSVPLEALLADDEARVIIIGLPGASDGEAFTLANRLASHLAGELSETEVEIVPTIGVGVATGVEHRDADELLAAARAAAQTSVDNLDGAAVLDAVPSPLPRGEGGQAVSR